MQTTQRLIETALSKLAKEEIVELTRDLVRIPSVVRQDGSGNEEEVARFVEGKLRELQFDEIKVDEVIPHRPNIIATMNGTKEGQTILLEAHTDVVSEGDPGDWVDPPFEAIVKDGRIYGRGSCDTKNNLASAMLAIAAIRRANIEFPGRILLAIPVDEEGMMSGIKHMIKGGYVDHVDGALICEPEDNQLCIMQKGALRAVIRCRGKMSHGCMPLTGFNSTIPMARILLLIKNLEKEEIQRLGYHEFLGFPSMTPTVVQSPSVGEAQLNVQPSDCAAYMDIRTVPGQEHEDLRQRLVALVEEVEAQVQEDLRSGYEGDVRKTLAEHELLPPDIAFTASIEFVDDRPWTVTRKDDQIVEAACSAHRLITGREPVFNGVPGATDGTFLNSWKKIPILTTGSGDRMVPHQKDEWVSIDQLVETTKLYVATILFFLFGDSK